MEWSSWFPFVCFLQVICFHWSLFNQTWQYMRALCLLIILVWWLILLDLEYSELYRDKNTKYIKWLLKDADIFKQELATRTSFILEWMAVVTFRQDVCSSSPSLSSWMPVINCHQICCVFREYKLFFNAISNEGVQMKTNQ